MKQAALLDSERRGTFQITQRGKELIGENPARIDVAFLNRFPEFRAFRTRRRDKADVVLPSQEAAPDQTPQDDLASAYQKLRSELEQELLEQVKVASPSFFERLVIDLLVAMGYGGRVRMLAERSVGAVTKASTASSRRIGSDWT